MWNLLGDTALTIFSEVNDREVIMMFEEEETLAWNSALTSNNLKEEGFEIMADNWAIDVKLKDEMIESMVTEDLLDGKTVIKLNNNKLNNNK